MARIGYFRTSAADQSIASQRAALGGTFDEEFADEGISGAVAAADRPGFAQLLAYARKGDTVCVYAVDRLGRDAIDVQQTVKALQGKGVTVEVHGLGTLTGQVGKLLLALLAQFAEMERERIRERTAAGRAVAKQLIAQTGRTQHGKASMGRPRAAAADVVKAWRAEHSASIKATAAHFGLSTATVSRYCASAAPSASAAALSPSA